VEILTAAAEGDNEERPAQLLVASSSLRVCEYYCKLLLYWREEKCTIQQST
jgi:hypothetical protein